MARLLARIALLLAAVLTGAGAASLYAKPSDPGMQRILVAEHEIRYGHRLTHDDLGWAELPRDSVPNGAFTSIEALFGTGADAEPRTALRTILKGEPLLRARLSGFAASTRLAAQLPEGKRAYTIPIADTSGGRLIGPGDRVDVVLTKTADGELLSKVIMQDLPVIAVDRDRDEEPAGADRSMATIEVTRIQAQQLLLAERVGALLLTPRGGLVGEEIDLADTSAFDFEVDEPKVDAPRWFERPLCYGFDPQSESLWGRCRSPRNRFRGAQTVEDSPEMLEQKRQQLEREQRRVAEELKRLQRKSSEEED